LDIGTIKYLSVDGIIELKLVCPANEAHQGSCLNTESLPTPVLLSLPGKNQNTTQYHMNLF